MEREGQDLGSTWTLGCLKESCGICSQKYPKTKVACLVTFEEDKLAIFPLVGSVDGRRQAPPELADGHWVAIHHLVIPHPPEPAFLEGSWLGGVCYVL